MENEFYTRNIMAGRGEPVEDSSKTGVFFLDEKWIFICTNASHMSTARAPHRIQGIYFSSFSNRLLLLHPPPFCRGG